MADPAPKTAAAPVAAAAPSMTPVLIYGIVADALCVIPIVLYMVLGSTKGYNKYHQTMINMLVSAWMPFAITWIIVMAADSTAARAALTGAMSMAGLGPFALQWVGLMAFIMASHSAGTILLMPNIVFVAIYFVMNVGMVVMHWMLSAGVYEWIKNAPLPAAAVKIAAKPAAKPAADADAAKADNGSLSF